MATGTAAKAGAQVAKVRQQWARVQVWLTEGIAKREIARRLDMPDPSFRDAYAKVRGEQAAQVAPAVYEGAPAHTPAVDTQVYQGIPLSTGEEARATLVEVHTLLPLLRELAQDWPALRGMLQDWTQQRQLLQVSQAYQPYDGYYSCRLNTRLIQAIKDYAAQHRLSQSELVTLALQTYMEKGTE
jgi:hypothetical protein